MFVSLRGVERESLLTRVSVAVGPPRSDLCDAKWHRFALLLCNSCTGDALDACDDSVAGLCSKLCLQTGCSAACLIAAKLSREAVNGWNPSTAVVYSAQHKRTLAVCNETLRFTRFDVV